MNNNTPVNNNKFEANKKYFTICIYALFVILLGSLIIKAIIDWSGTVRTISHYINVLSPFFLGIILAYILSPLVHLLNKHIFKKFKFKSAKPGLLLSILFTYIIVFSFIALILNYMVPQLFFSTGELFNQLEGLYQNILAYLMELENKYTNVDFELVNKYLNEVVPNLVTKVEPLLTGALPALFTTSMSVIKGIINIIIAIMISCYILADTGGLIRVFKRLIYAVMNKKTADTTVEIIKDCHHIFSGFIFGKTVDSLIIGIICFMLLSIFGFDYAFLISVIVGITNMIPYFGPYIGAIPGIIIQLSISPLKALLFAILILVIQQFDGIYLGPKILGDSTGLKPIWIIFAITLGGSIAGVAGMFLGVPIVAVIGYLFNRWINFRLGKKKLNIPL